MDDETTIDVALGCVRGFAVPCAVSLFGFETIFKTRFGIDVAALFADAKCAACGSPLPHGVRTPKTLYPMLWGGWTCEECGLELDKWGNPR